MSDKGSNSEVPNNNSWNHGQFITKIIKATIDHPISISQLPKTIDLSNGKIAEISHDLLIQTLDDPRRRERGKVAKVDLDGKIRIPQKATIGDEFQIQTVTELFLDEKNNRREYNAFSIHTHGVLDVPPSPEDFANLLVPSKHEDIQIPGGVQAEIVITPSARFLMIKTSETPNMTEQEAANFVDKK